MGQRSAQKRRVVNGVEGKLPTYAVCRAYYNGRKNTHPVLGPSKVITAHCVRLRRIAHVYEISVDEGRIPTPVFCGGVSKREEFRNDVADVLGGLAKA